MTAPGHASWPNERRRSVPQGAPSELLIRDPRILRILRALGDWLDTVGLTVLPSLVSSPRQWRLSEHLLTLTSLLFKPVYQEKQCQRAAVRARDDPSRGLAVRLILGTMLEILSSCFRAADTGDLNSLIPRERF